MKRVELFKTVHGSHLYGLAHENSDNDWFTVVRNEPKTRARYAKQTISEDDDNLVMDFGTWLHYCAMGVPQALEAMFSNMAVKDSLEQFRASYTVSTPVFERYLRTMTAFAHTQDYKRKRHGLRLALNMYEMSRYGRFNPTLNGNQVDFVSDVAHKDTDVVYAYCMNIALDRLPPGMVP
jgi:hypothetical protein